MMVPGNMGNDALSSLTSLQQRIVSAAILLPVAVMAVWMGGWVFAAFVIVAGIAMSWEWASMIHGRPWGAEMYLLAGAVLASGVGAMALPPAFAVLCAGAFWAVAVVGALIRRQAVFWHALAIPYICLPVISLILLRRDPDIGFAAILWLFCVVWATDICAYVSGRTVGGPKLVRRVSPNKTWSGLAGGILGAGLVGAITARALGESDVTALALLSAILAVAAQAGDIGESAMKRHFGVKDSSNLIPGHGGVMDRVDGLVTAAILAFAIGWLRSGEISVVRGVLVW